MVFVADCSVPICLVCGGGGSQPEARGNQGKSSTKQPAARKSEPRPPTKQGTQAFEPSPHSTLGRESNAPCAAWAAPACLKAHPFACAACSQLGGPFLLPSGGPAGCAGHGWAASHAFQPLPRAARVASPQRLSVMLLKNQRSKGAQAPELIAL